MKHPLYLRKGDVVGVVSPAGSIPPSVLSEGIRILEFWGLVVKVGSHALCVNGVYAGMDQERASDLQLFLDDPDVKAIFCTRGGYGTVRLLDYLNFEGFSKNPKWIVGFSDITVLHAHIQKLFQIPTLHAPMLKSFDTSTPALDYLYKALFGEPVSYQWQGALLNRAGRTQAPIVGGNLSVLYSLRGTPAEVNLCGKILFIEDLNEYYYHLDRMMMNLKYGGLLASLSGLLVGQFTSMMNGVDTYNKTAEEIIKEHVEEYTYPVAFGFSAGHIPNNLPLFMGMNAKLKVEDSGAECSLEFEDSSTVVS